MCAPATCPRCQKVTWSGCGQHADAVLAPFPASRRCTCRAEAAPSVHVRGGRR